MKKNRLLLTCLLTYELTYLEKTLHLKINHSVNQSTIYSGFKHKF